MADKNHIDPERYLIDPERGIHRSSFPDPDGEQTVIATAKLECSEAEWDLIREALQMVCAQRSIQFGEWPARRVN
jgi:hypothetical protein